jgi:CheY-like chemotaxis protein
MSIALAIARSDTLNVSVAGLFPSAARMAQREQLLSLWHLPLRCKVPTMPTRVMIVDDQEVVRLGLKRLFEGSDLAIVDEAASASETLTKVAVTTAEIVLLDVRLPETDGLNLLARIKLDRPDLPVLLFSAYENPNFVARAVGIRPERRPERNPAIVLGDGSTRGVRLDT